MATRLAGRCPSGRTASVHRALTDPSTCTSTGDRRAPAQERVFRGPRPVSPSPPGVRNGATTTRFDLRPPLLASRPSSPEQRRSLWPGGGGSLHRRRWPRAPRSVTGSSALRGTQRNGAELSRHYSPAAGSAPLPSGRRRTRRGGAPREGEVARADGRLPGPIGAASVAQPPRRAPSPGR